MIALKDSLGSDWSKRFLVFFSEKGLLAKAEEFRISAGHSNGGRGRAHVEEERHLVIEAGTGVGKSIAYLVPAVLYAVEQSKKAIISTYTISLQEQLLHKDIPIVKRFCRSSSKPR